MKDSQLYDIKLFIWSSLSFIDISLIYSLIFSFLGFNKFLINVRYFNGILYSSNLQFLIFLARFGILFASNGYRLVTN